MDPWDLRGASMSLTVFQGSKGVSEGDGSCFHDVSRGSHGRFMGLRKSRGF